MEKNFLRHPVCDLCGAAILNEYVMQVDGRFWHEDCLRCSDCDEILTSQCYMRDRKLLCQEDYNRRKSCFNCGKIISPSEYIQKVKFLNDVAVCHVKCFICTVCRRVLEPGNEFMMSDEGRLLCTDDSCLQVASEEQETEEKNPNQDGMGDSNHVTDFELTSEIDLTENSLKEKPNSEFECYNCSNIDELSLPDSCEFKISHAEATSSSKETEPVNCGREARGLERAKTAIHEPAVSKTKGKRRGPRTTIKPSQLEALKAAFQTSQKPTKSTREKLSKETGLEMRVIQVQSLFWESNLLTLLQVWFQNRRSKERRVNQATKINPNQTFFDGNPGSKFISHTDYPFYNTGFSEQYTCSHACPSSGHYSCDDFLPQATWRQDHLNSSFSNHFALSPECASSKSYTSQYIIDSAVRREKDRENFNSGITSRNHDCTLENHYTSRNHATHLMCNPLYHR